MITLGVDPDTHFMPVSVVEDGRVIHISTITIPKTCTSIQSLTTMASVINRRSTFNQLSTIDVDKIVVESQEVYIKTITDPNNLILLAQVTGLIICRLAAIFPSADIAVPQPKEWKGQVPKQIHHRRIVEELGLDYREKNGKIIPEFNQGTHIEHPFSEANTHHVLDSIGLALWGAELKSRVAFLKASPL